MIYADNAATTKLDIDAFETMKPYLLEQYGNPSQSYSFSRTVKKALNDARTTIAECIGALPEEIFFTSGGTESDNWAVKGSFTQNRDEVITSLIEHHAILRACDAAKRNGKKVHLLDVDQQGIVSLSELERFITDKTALVSVMYANNEIGTIEPIKEIAGISHEYGTIMHTDAVQAIGHVPINVNELGVDLLSASAHKFNGPRGIGFFYIRKGTDIKPLMDGGGQERKMRAGTENVAAAVGMAVALRKNCNQLSKTQKRLCNIEKKFIEVLDKNSLEYIRNGATDRIPGNISLSIKNMNGEMLMHRLDLKGISVSTGAACNSGETEISHVIKAISVPENYAKGTIRISFGKDNTEDDAIIIANEIAAIIARR